MNFIFYVVVGFLNGCNLIYVISVIAAISFLTHASPSPFPPTPKSLTPQSDSSQSIKMDEKKGKVTGLYSLIHHIALLS